MRGDSHVLWRRTRSKQSGHRAPGRPHKNMGLARLPSRQFAINAAWVELILTAADLIAWTNHPARRRPRQRRTRDAALPAAARRRQDHSWTTPAIRPHRQDLAPARAIRRRLRSTPRPTPADHLTATPSDHPQTDLATPATAPARPACRTRNRRTTSRSHLDLMYPSQPTDHVPEVGRATATVNDPVPLPVVRS
jgi:hypothetical protein